MSAKEKATKFSKDFMAFAMKGNVVDMAVGVMIGGAFGKIVSSLVSDVVMPLIGLLTGGINLTGLFMPLDGKSYQTLAEAQSANAATLNYGVFLQTVIDFVIIALCIFLFLKALRMKKKETPMEEKRAPVCPHCLMEVKEGATRCPHCTSEIPQT